MLTLDAPIGKMKLLIVDDDETSLLTLRNFAINNEWEAITAIDGSEALDKLEKEKPDVLIVDQRMPQITGSEMIKTMRRIKKNIPTILMSADPNIKLLAKASGTQFYIKKPFSFSELTDTLLGVMSQRSEKLPETPTADDYMHSGFFSAMVHELRSPLQPIISISDLIINCPAMAANDEMQEYARILHRSVKKHSMLMDRLSEYFKSEFLADCSEFTEIRSVYQRVYEEFADLLEKKRGKIILKDFDDLILPGDNTSYEILFRNLIKNALTYCEKQPIITINARRELHHYMITFTDNGLGIPQDKMNMVMMPFKRLHPSYDRMGSGLGLSICKRIVDALSGEILFQSQLNEGTTIQLKIPVVAH